MHNSIDNEWFKFITNNNLNKNSFFENNSENNDMRDSINDENDEYIISNNIPKCSNIYISTKTKISYLNQSVDLFDLFWKIPVIEYYIPKEGIIKKQIKIQTFNNDDLESIKTKLTKYYYHKSYIIAHIENPEGKIKFKDTRKISIGINKKDIINTRSKEKSAFYNCFVLVVRVLLNDEFKEIHVKIFNTGKLEIPGIKNDDSLFIVLDKMINILNKLENTYDFQYNKDLTETVLINSNFNCGYFINREKLYNILRDKYNINSCYDPCSYPGIQSEFYYNKVDKTYVQNGVQPSSFKNDYVKISFMIFRTGSILMVGKGNETILNCIYEFLKKILYTEYYLICTPSDIKTNKIKEKKIKKKIIYMEK